MATEIGASGHASATDEQIVKKEKSEAIAHMIASLANEDEVKHDKISDEDGHVTNPLSKTGNGTNDEVGAVEVQKSDDSPALAASAEDNLKHGKIEDAQTQEDDTKAEPDVVSVEKTDDLVSLEAHIEDNLKGEKEVIPALHATDDAAKSQPEELPFTEPTVEETPQQPEAEAEVNTRTEAEAELVKEAETFETSYQKEEKTETEPVATEVEEKPQEPEKELEAVVVKEAEILEISDRKEDKPEPEPVVLATEVEGKSQEPEKESEAEVVKEAKTLETSDKKEEKPEHEVVALIPEIQRKTEEPEKESQEKPQEAEQGTIVTVAEPFTEVITIEEKTRELSAEILKETNDSEAAPTETSKAEQEVEENPKEPEKESLEQKEEKQPNNVAIAEVSSETIEAIEEKTIEQEVLNETNNYETEPTEVERAELEVTKVDENSSEPEKKSIKQEEEELPKTVIPEKPTTGDIVKVQPPEESDIEVVKEIANSETEAVLGKEEKPGNGVVVHQPIELDIEVVKENGTNELEAVPANITENTALVSLNEEAQAAPENLVELAPEVSEKVVEEDGKNKSSFTDVIEGVPKDEVGIVKIPGQASIDQEAKSDIEEKGDSIPTSVEEKVAITVDDDKKEPKAPGSVQVSSREAEVEINKDEKQFEAKTATTEDDEPAVKNENGGHIDTKVDGIFSAVSEPVRETLASKFEEKETKTEVNNLEKEQSEEPVKTEVQVPKEPTQESDATKTSSKDLPKESKAKTAQKQSNSIISKVKQSLVKARKAIIGKSPSSKNHSSEAKDDIQVK
ncbi:PREDICTED: neurofilament heavy polypeptide-like isoform X6 [Lupinus angustifolius]|uniref:neurofilament heavy polypeptide-like isoform X6 n=1 Tax=Lupinus angustifolius TaxID=3871 RepID=UPI00092F6151|nr:PREDICTED: neurofilament heavy polypeptide-like isoform X6 [Lupinus angustifolius]